MYLIIILLLIISAFAALGFWLGLFALLTILIVCYNLT